MNPKATTITHSQVRETNSRQPSWSSARKFGAPSRRPRATRISARKTALAKNVPESIAIAQPAPTAATSTPPSAAPPIDATFSAIRSNAFACWSRGSSTVCGTSPVEAGKKNANAVPPIACRTIKCQSSAFPVSSSSAVTACAEPVSTSEATITRFRGSRSAQTPPTSMKTSCGTIRAASTSPRSDAEPVRSRTANAIATGAIALPKNEIPRARKRRRNSRRASGPRRLRGLGTLVDVAPQPCVRLLERHRLRVHVYRVRIHRPQVGDGRRCELVLGGAARNALEPLVQAVVELVEMPPDVLGDAEVDQREPFGLTASELGDRRAPGLDVQVGRRRGREHGPCRGDPHAGGVARIERPVGAHEADVVARVARRREALEPDHLRPDDVDVGLGHGHDLAPEPLEVRPVQPARARDQLPRVDEVRRADPGGVNLGVGVLAHEHAGRARVIEVDVREQQMTDVFQGEAALGQPLPKRLGTRRRPAVEERRALGRVEQIAPDHALVAEVEEIERLDVHAAHRTSGGGDRPPPLDARAYWSAQ